MDYDPAVYAQLCHDWYDDVKKCRRCAIVAELHADETYSRVTSPMEWMGEALIAFTWAQDKQHGWHTETAEAMSSTRRVSPNYRRSSPSWRRE